MSVIEGRCWVFGDDIDTDIIIPARYVILRELSDMAVHTMEPVEPKFGTECRPGDIVVAGKFFGAGSSREAAALLFKLLRVGAIVAESYARIFFRNAINNGIYALEAPGVCEVARQTGDVLRIDLDQSVLTNQATGKEVPILPWAPAVRALVEAGGLVPFVKSGRRGLAG
jgi:3-isopropylmalate/(R)-2-methylmalate dehydratase small subunit